MPIQLNNLLSFSSDALETNKLIADKQKKKKKGLHAQEKYV